MPRGKLLSGSRKARANIEGSRRQERETASDTGGRVQPGSGSRWHSKGDVRDQEALIECKQTGKDSFILKITTLHKIVIEAYKEGKRPVLQVEFAHAVPGKFAVITWDDYIRFTREQPR